METGAADFGLPVSPGAGEFGAEPDDAVAPRADSGDGAFVPPAAGAPGSPAVPAGAFAAVGREGGWFVGFFLAGADGLVPLHAPSPGEVCCPGRASFAAVPAGVDAAWFEAGAGEFGPSAGPATGAADFAFSAAAGFGSSERAGPPAPGSAVSGEASALEVSRPDAVAPVGAWGPPGRCALAMRSVGAADETGPPLLAVGIRSVAASGRASAPAVSAWPALSRAGFFSSFGSDTHTPR
ncbi:hypothetical protein ACRS6B_05340 [Nocardia asteroides]